MRRTGAGFAFLLVMMLVVGCGGDEQFGELSGTITYDGKAIENGAITFYPEHGPTAGSIITEGRYSTKVSLGPAKVMISSSKVVGEKKVYNTPDSPAMPLTAEALPAKYNTATELRQDITPGKQTKDFNLAK
ncbi:MAG: hypothetical protein K8U57_25685 [Planctomycetes bacterium]|nr:hypothetical protein [Planctomycetota bacterium]